MKNVTGIGRRLQLLRKRKGLTAQAVAAAIGVPVTTYREWEYGRAIQGEPYLMLSKFLEVSLYELLSGEKNQPSSLLRDLGIIEDHVKKIRIQLLSCS